MAPLGRSFAVRFTVPLLVAGTLAAAPPTVALAATDHSATTAALAAERYLSSYGNPTTLTPPAPAAVDTTSTTGPSWTTAILAAVGLAIAAGLTGIVGGRATVRPKRITT